MRSIGLGLALTLVITALLAPVRAPHAAAQTTVTNLNCGLMSCSGTTGDSCAGAVRNIGVSVDLAGARARAGSMPEWLPATLQPDLVTFTSTRTDAGATDQTVYEVSRTSLQLTWRWSHTAEGAAPVSAVGRYQCGLVHAQF